MSEPTRDGAVKAGEVTIAYLAMGFAKAWTEAYKEDADLPPQLEAMLQVLEFADIAEAEECDDCHPYDVSEPFGEALTRAILNDEEMTQERAKAILREVHSGDCMKANG